MAIDKVQENRIRRALDRRGFRLHRNRRRDVNALDYGRYQLFDRYTGNLVDAGDDMACWFTSLDGVEKWMEQTAKKELSS